MKRVAEHVKRRHPDHYADYANMMAALCDDNEGNEGNEDGEEEEEEEGVGGMIGSEPLRPCPYCNENKTWRGMRNHVSRKHADKKDDFAKVSL